MRVVVVGGGPGGLATAKLLGGAGHDVVVVERDDTPMPESADEAFEWDRRGAPQVRHSHALLARLRNLLRDEHPEVLAALLAEGATEIRFGENLPPEMEFAPDPGDDDLAMIACRRTTFEWVLRRTAMEQGAVALRTGVGVAGLLTARPSGARAEADAPVDVPRVVGVRLEDGTEIAADLVVAANGRRGAVPAWLAEIGAGEVTEAVDDTGIVYLSRFYRLRDGHDRPPSGGAIGGDLGYIKYGTFVGDNRTFSVTLAVPSDDDDLRRTLKDPDTFDAAARSLPATAPWLDGRATPITPSVHVMAGLVNKFVDLLPGGELVVVGFVGVGDAVVCTNPLYGRGCSTAFWSASLLANAVAQHPHDLAAMALAYETSLREEILPWYRSSVEQDREARRVAAALLAGEDPYPDPSDPRAFARSVFRDGLAPALRIDVVVLRAFMRNLNLLSPPDALLRDSEVSERVLAVLQTKDSRPAEPSLGPATRAEFVALATDR